MQGPFFLGGGAPHCCLRGMLNSNLSGALTSKACIAASRS